MVGAILAQNTAWSNVEKAIRQLKAARGMSLQKIAGMPRPRLEKLIRSSGYFRQKAERLQVFARYMQKNPDFYLQLTSPSPGPAGLTDGPPGVWRLRPPSASIGRGRKVPFSLGREKGLGDEGLQALRSRLLAMKGIGPETADSILLYAGRYPTFVVDAYTRRIGQRLGLFRFHDYARVQSYFERALPKKSALYNEYHALWVMLAKTVCRKRDPRCGACPIQTECRYGNERSTGCLH
ncbi:MAG: hypothetical protein A2992_08880 [Elusimicrobia bacterium RIFCSPLOWO2_01_FULL_59_12]|nr:MAG: hypothetical protein A2992_08880 [Elusimicrobia bacterium RIFCSPLOWO2_01_FULL_59_12]